MVCRCLEAEKGGERKCMGQGARMTEPVMVSFESVLLILREIPYAAVAAIKGVMRRRTGTLRSASISSINAEFPGLCDAKLLRLTTRIEIRSGSQIYY